VVVIGVVLVGLNGWTLHRARPNVGHEAAGEYEAVSAPISASARSSSPALQTPASESPAAQPAAVPVEVSIARLNISSSLQALGLEKDGSLQSPSEWGRAGWYAGGVRPGDVGPAVIAGHIDSTAGPAVFYKLPSARIGDDVVVTDATGRSRHFTVNDIEQYPKQKFPSSAVYGPAAVPTLRLVTCYGAFDAGRNSYVDNVVVSAVLAR
jgi:sortase (surface protein transpeptidase)